MTKRHVVVVIVCIGVLALLLPSAMRAGYIQHNYSEEFSTYDYRDIANTTAWWDTFAGELKLNLLLQEMGSCTVAAPGGVEIAGDYAFVLDFNYGLRVVDISDPANPSVVGSVPTSMDAYALYLAGDYAFIAVDAGGPGSLMGGIDVIDVTDPTNPLSPVHLNIPSVEPVGVAVDGNFAYLATGSGGLAVVDVTDPTSPSLCGSVATPGNAQDIYVVGDYAYIGDMSGLTVADVSDSCSPTIAGNLALPGTQSIDVVVDGDYCYLYDRDASPAILTVDVSDPTNPSLVASRSIPGAGAGGDLEIIGDYLYVAAGDAGALVLDISDPANLEYIGYFGVQGGARGLAVAGEHVLVSDHPGNVRVVDRVDLVDPPALVDQAALTTTA